MASQQPRYYGAARRTRWAALLSSCVRVACLGRPELVCGLHACQGAYRFVACEGIEIAIRNATLCYLSE